MSSHDKETGDDFPRGYKLFPVLLPSVQSPMAQTVTQHCFRRPEGPVPDVTIFALIKAAWAVVASHITSSENVVFGVTTSSEPAAFYVNVSRRQNVSQYVQAIKLQSTQIADAASILNNGQATQFQTLLDFHSQHGSDSVHNNKLLRFSEYALILQICLDEDQIVAKASFCPSTLSLWTMERLLHRLGHVLTQLATAADETTLSQVDLIAQEDLHEIWKWNNAVPATFEYCLHEVFEDLARKQPGAPAVSAWDGDLTYGKLNDLATNVANILTESGIGSGTIVPLCFEKSMWTTVAILGVLKTGAAFVLLDPSLPHQRLKAMVAEVKGQLVISSSMMRKLSLQLGPDVKVMTLSKSFFADSIPLTQLHRPASEPSSLMYVVFTSGSTGVPKGVMIAHRNLASAVFHQVQALCISKASRVYDFVSYSYDPCISNVFRALSSGACLCVPSEEDRWTRLAESITSLRATFAELTPTTAQFLNPKEVPTLEIIMLGGEAVRLKDVEPWWNPGTIRFLNAYGPAECTPTSTVSCDAQTPEEATRIGKGLGQVTWVVDPDDYNKLVPTGSIGELLLEGPFVGLGYLNHAEKTADAFVSDPLWLLQGIPGSHPGRRGRLYKTGDLVHYHDDGSLEFVERKDAQVKIRGQRVELAEVEYRVREALPDVIQAVADVVTPIGQTGTQTLVVFLQIERESSACVPHVGLLPIPSSIEQQLAKHLPRYMVPSAFWAMNQLPTTATGKTDRKQLREVGSQFSLQQLAEIRAGQHTKRQPSTQTEKQLQRIWSQVLQISEDVIGLDDSFFQLGGDSIGAMRVVSAARKFSLMLTVADTFRNPRLEDLSACAIGNPSIQEVTGNIEPFSLLGVAPHMSTTELVLDIADHHQLDPIAIVDIYPCTPLQEGLMSLSAKQPGDYIMQAVLELDANLTVDTFCDAWEKTVRELDILRTRIIPYKVTPSQGVKLLQVVLDEGIHWSRSTGLQTYLRVDKAIPMSLAKPLARYALIKDDPAAPGYKYFVWTLNHALYDGWSIPLILTAVNCAYRGNQIGAPVQFKSFIKYITDKKADEVSNYWQEALEGYNSTPFPALPPSVSQPVTDSFIDRDIPLPTDNERSIDITMSTLLRAAWALVISRLNLSDDVLFGVTVSGRSASVVGIDAIAAPTFATVPVRVKLPSEDQQVHDYLKRIQQQSIEMIAFEQVGLQQIAKLSNDAQTACQFQTLLVIQPEENNFPQDDLGKWQLGSEQEQMNTYALILVISFGKTTTARAKFDSRVLDSWRVEKMLEQLEHLTLQLVASDASRKISEISTVTDHDITDIWAWNSVLPVTIEKCVHQLFEERAIKQPNYPAICAWDGDLTYIELDSLSNKLAQRLREHQLGPLVPICFEKSLWAVVALLGVLKSGAGFLLLDPKLPETRLKGMLQQVNPTLVLSSVTMEDLTCRLIASLELPVKILTIGPKMGLDLAKAYPGDSSLRPSFTQDPSSVAHIIFTSGSTGTPKGVMITHKNLSSAFHYQKEIIQLNSESRVYDFASYSFDQSIHNMLPTLAAGSCICIPNEEDRINRISESITFLRANVLHLTPTVARLLSAEDLPPLQLVMFDGEPVRTADIAPWWGKARVLHCYGPAECTCVTVMKPSTRVSTPAELAADFGHGVGVATWIVDPDNHHRLLTPGSVGEILLEGPLVGNGYLNDETKTASTFIDAPAWLASGAPGHIGRNGRLYKTGDLARYNKDGSLTSCGRKDAQVKIRGQRVELGEVEACLQNYWPQARRAIAELILPDGNESSRVLAAFLQLEEDKAEHDQSNLDQPGSRAKLVPVPDWVEDRLKEVLPIYMVPTVFFIVLNLPMTHNGKINRRKLREIGASFSVQQIAKAHATRSAGTTRRLPKAEIDRKLQMIWANVLGIQSELISLDENFFQLGGDSVAAMKVVSAAWEAGIHLTVADVFRKPKLWQMAGQGHSLDHRTTHENLQAFELIQNSPNVTSVIHQASSQCGVASSVIQDLYPCTPLQQGLLSLSSKRTGDYMMQKVLELSHDISIDHFCEAWSQVSSSLAILRTRIIQSDIGILQVILDEKIGWIRTSGLESYLQADRDTPIDLGQPLVRYALVSDETGTLKWFVWTLHHATYDGWSLPLIMDKVWRTYLGQRFETGIQFNKFIKHIQARQEAGTAEYWRQNLAGWEGVSFPELPPSLSSTQHVVADATVEFSLPRVQASSLDITTSTIIRAAWALVAGCMTNAEDVVFGATLSGRNVPINGISTMAAPAITTVPLRVKWTKEQKVADYLRTVQCQAIDMIPFEQTGLQEIIKLVPEGRQACDFQTLLVIQPEDDIADHSVLGKWQNDTQDEWFNTHALLLEVTLSSGNTISTRASFASSVVESWMVHKLLQQLDYVMRQLCDNVEQSLGEIKMVAPQDLAQLWQWNDSVPEAVKGTIHEIIQMRARIQPEAPAILAWDGQLTYGKLDLLAEKLACYLVDCGVRPGDIVPVAFEKSLWTSVAILAVLKAGGAFVLLDVSLPLQRLKTIVGEVGAKVIVSSIASRTLALEFKPNVISVGAKFFVDLHISRCQLPSMDPSSTAYVIFTSGRTGTPKGCVVTHENIASSTYHQNDLFGITSETRVYDFSSYAFGTSIKNFLWAFQTGGCLCVPSDDDRKSRLAESITKLGANIVELTPAVARCLQPEEVPGLKTLLLGGEASSVRDVERWWGKASVIQSYGASECTSASVVNHKPSSPKIAIHIGKGAGLVTWVVDPDDHERLLPIGCIGELLLEGPLVGSGYLNSQEKTDEVFINDPPWLLCGPLGSQRLHSRIGHGGRHGRMYKTGDLVRYNADGSLAYLGRKDAQVKIRGQRVELAEAELAEVEHGVERCMLEAREIVAEVIVPQGHASKANAMLVVFVVLIDDPAVAREYEKVPARILAADRGLDARLAEQLPSYMVPAVFFAMRELPLTPTLKMDRKKLREIGGSFSSEELAAVRPAGQGPKRQPTSDVARQIQRNWGQVLNIPSTSIGLDDSFYQWGGDSITAMQSSSALRASGINIRVADILQKKTIASLINGLACSDTVQYDVLTETHGDLSGLSPIQRLYFHAEPHPTTPYDQCFLLRFNNRRVGPEALRATLATLLGRHTILRTRFRKNQDGSWEQHISSNVSESFRLQLQESACDTAEIIRETRQSLDIEHGPLVAAVLFDSTKFQSFFISIHHLVIDLVSWRVLFKELEELLTAGTINAPPPMGFQTWNSLQTKFAVDHLKPEGIFPIESQISRLAYWGMQETINDRGSTVVKRFTIDKVVTSAILGRCNDAFTTRPLELLLSALIYSYGIVFADRPTPTVFTEGHGREPWDDRIDISSTVGWFTTLFPVQLPTDLELNLWNIIRLTKDHIRGLPKNGWSYFTSRFATDTNANRYASEFPVEILFNYTGRYQQLEREDGMFHEMPLPERCLPASSNNLRRLSLFDFDVQVDRGQLVVQGAYPRGSQHQEKISQWIGTYSETIKEIASGLTVIPPSWTLSDFPSIFRSYADINHFNDFWLPRLRTSLDEIENIFPCSSVQEGIMMSQAKDTALYRTWTKQRIEIPGQQSRLDLSRLQQAWRSVVRRHTLLRAILVDDFPGTDRTMHVILKDPTPGLTCLKWADDATETRLGDTTLTYKPTYHKYGLHHHLTIYEVDERTAFVKLEVDHVITDAISSAILWKDLQDAYNDSLSPATAQYEDFISYLDEQPHDGGSDFWTQYLGDVQPCIVQGPREGPRETNEGDINAKTVHVPAVDTAGIRAFCMRYEVTPATVIQVAWALVLSKYTSTPTPCFGHLLSGRDVPVGNAPSIYGPLIAVVPCRVAFGESENIIDALKATQRDYLDSLPYQHFPLATIHKSLGLGTSALFNSGVSFQRPDKRAGQLTNGLNITPVSYYDPTEHDISITAVDDEEMRIYVKLRAGFLNLYEARRLASSLSTAVSQIITSPSRHWTELTLLGDEDLARIWEWNNTVPVKINRCVTEIILERVQSQPSAPAICAWDGELTYTQLDRLSSQLAHYISDLGVRPGILVPLCFEKSMWTMVAVIAVLKAGGGFVLLDTSLPEQRLQVIVQQVKAGYVLSSLSMVSLASCLASNVIAIPRDLFAEMKNETMQVLHEPNSSSTMYVVFTSGSTGTPKGVMISHANASSALFHQVENVLGFSPDTRMYDFVSYGFDIAISNAFTTLAAGGCLCVPSEGDRVNNLQQSIVSLRANTMCLTPSVAQFLSPEETGLRTVLFGGESLRIQDIMPWWGKARIIHGYGPAECTQTSTINGNPATPEEVLNIGKGAGLVTWIVDPDNGDCLLPIGCVGELYLEGPLVGLGYLDETASSLSFIENPAWLSKGMPGRPGRRGRLYRTGDMVRYEENGNLTFMGRKDAQVKIHGQRIELGEVEHCVHEHFTARQVVVEVIRPKDSANPELAAFIDFGNEEPSNTEHSAEAGTHAVVNVLPADPRVEGLMAKQLPNYMIPTVYFSAGTLPMTTTGKTDRKRVREIGGSFSLRQIAELRNPQGTKRQPTTQAEQQLQEIWATVLQLHPTSEVGLDDSFFQLGGDSIAAMKVVKEAHHNGIDLAMADIFSYPRLKDLAHNALRAITGPPSNILPFSLLGDGVDTTALLNNVTRQYGIEESVVEDAYPCTALQEGLFSMSLKQPGAFVMQAVLELAPGIDVELFRKAWRDVSRSMDILRTRIVHSSEIGLIQLVLDKDVHWHETTQALDDYLSGDRGLIMEMGEPLARYTLVQNKWFVWTLHHALYDGQSLPIITDAVNRTYGGTVLAQQPQFNEFIQYATSKEDAETTKYWRETLADCNSSPFPALPASVERPVADRMETRQISHLSKQSSDILTSTVLRATWALVVGNLTGSTDVVFGDTISGRNAPVPRIADITGPTIATVPVCVPLQMDQKATDFLATVQQRATEMIPFEQTGLHQISKTCSGAWQACKFQTLLVVQPLVQQDVGPNVLGRWQDSNQNQWFNTYALLVEVQLGVENVTIHASFDSRVIDAWTVRKLLQRFESVMDQLESVGSEKTLSKINFVTPEDLDDIWQWNGAVPDPFNHCVHEIVSRQARLQPMAPAVCAWDGELSYNELDELSTDLATYISSFIQPEALVPLCFEKSLWATVAMLGVLKAGAGFVLLEPSLPEQRLKSIVEQIQGSLIVSSTTNRSLSSRLIRNVVTIDRDFFAGRVNGPVASTGLPRSNPASVMYVVFTSGSTGTPKGVVVTHRNLASALRHQAQLLGLSSTSRLYDFSSYSFDASIMNTYNTLAAGGCLCVPSEADRRSRLQESLVSMRATSVLLTPSVAQSLALDPSQMPDLTTIIFGGEAVRARDIEPWWGKVKVVQAYGPSECTPTSTINCSESTIAEATRIGKGAGTVTWVVDPADYTLLPPGCTGELLVEGPLIGRGYLNEPDKTAAAFIIDPPWLIEGAPGYPGRHGRLYKTGDLVCYNEDGSLSYVGRKDTQIKIHGQRVELGEVEYRVHGVMPEANQVIAEMITPTGQNAIPVLAVFVRLGDERKTETGKRMARVIMITAGARDELDRKLPSYMIPTAFFSMAELPVTPSGKIDRSLLQKIGSSFSLQELAEMRTTSEGSTKRMPFSQRACKMQSIWARVLGIASTTIGLDDSFFQLGGDSITAMRVVGEARRAGTDMTVADIFLHPTLALLERLESPIEIEVGCNDNDIDNHALIDAKVKTILLEAIKSQKLGIYSRSVVDVLPVTHFQAECLNTGIKYSRQFCNYFYLDLIGDVDVARFTESCTLTLQRYPIFRSHFLYLHGKFWQVILDQVDSPLRVHETNGDLASSFRVFCLEDVERVSPTGPPVACTLLRHGAQGARLVLRISHAQYDGISLPLIFRSLVGGYINPPPQRYTDFSRYLAYASLRQGKAIKYWTKLLKDSEMTDIRSRIAPESLPRGSPELIRAESQLALPRLGGKATLASLISLAWALLQSRLLENRDIVFGRLVAGRNSSLDQVDEVMGPCVNVVPIRVELSPNKTPAELLFCVQEQFIELGEADSLGLQDIVDNCTDWHTTSDFDSVLQHQNIEEHTAFKFGEGVSQVGAFENPHYVQPSIYITSRSQEGCLRLDISTNSHIMTSRTAKGLLSQLKTTIEVLEKALDAATQSTIDDLGLMSQGSGEAA